MIAIGAQHTHCVATAPRCQLAQPSRLSLTRFGSTAALVLIPDQNIVLVVLQDAIAASLLAGAGALFIGGFAVNALNE